MQLFKMQIASELMTSLPARLHIVQMQPTSCSVNKLAGEFHITIFPFTRGRENAPKCTNNVKSLHLCLF